MQFFMFMTSCLFTSIISLSISITLPRRLSQEIDYDFSYNPNDTLQQLESLDSDPLQQIETALNQTIGDIRNILTNGDKQRQISTIKKLNFVLTDMFFDTISEIQDLKEFVNKVLIPNYIPCQFFCAWMLVLDVLDDVSHRQQLKFYHNRRKSIFQLVDKVTNKNSERKQRRLSKDEFIAVLQMLGPKLEQPLIEKIAKHSVPDYKYRGKKVFYYEEVLLGFTAWIRYFNNSATIFKYNLIEEFKQHHNDWIAATQKFALIMSRDHFLANNIRYWFWINCTEMIVRGCKMDFEDILDSVFTGGWYYEQQNIDQFELLVRVLKKTTFENFYPQQNFTLEYESFLKRPEVGMPQSSACYGDTQRNITYFLKKWGTTFLPSK